MSMTSDQILDAALSLPDCERVEITEALIASLQPQDRPPFSESWRAVIEHRSAELRSGQVTPVPWETVKSKAKEKRGE